ncbi:hypothetical protein [Moorena bouillonii]|uniref:hypothetical protein n=1 Tax=Moorena bouillonii TaxID=207920 RepID=UPI00117C025D|nr:hypothetical protein [Moorena bouillonii]
MPVSAENSVLVMRSLIPQLNPNWRSPLTPLNKGGTLTMFTTLTTLPAPCSLLPAPYSLLPQKKFVTKS